MCVVGSSLMILFSQGNAEILGIDATKAKVRSSFWNTFTSFCTVSSL